MCILKLFQKLLDSVTSNLVSNLNNTKPNNYVNKYTNSANNTDKYSSYVLGSGLGKNDTFSSKNAIFSKSINQLKNQLILTNNSINVNSPDTAYKLVQNVLYSTLQPKSVKECLLGKYDITKKESYYVDSKTYDFTKTKTTQITLNDIHRLGKTVNYPSHFNFNLKTNLILAQQQRWLAKNSLLTESITQNSFLLTQAKKLIGSGTLDKDSSNKTLWLPTKSSKLSSIESSAYFNNLTRQLFKKTSDSEHLYTNKLTHSFFNNLNFFENSRIFLLKKYYFTNNQSYNLFSSNPQNILSGADVALSTPIKNLSNTNFQTNLYATNLNFLIHNTVTPSLQLFLSKNKQYSTCNLSPHKLTSQNNISVSFSKLDVFSGSQNNFFFNITSNPLK
jgi:hypothetical protein